MTVYTGTTLTGLSYDELVSWINLSAGGNAQLDAWIAESANYGISEIEAIEDMAAQYMNFYKDGNGSYTITSFNNTAQITDVNVIDSNVSTIARGNVQTPLNRSIDSITGKIKMTKFPASGSFGQQASYVLGSVGSAVAAVSTGITLGKVIDGALYNANPDYWDSIGMSTLNPQTWNSITNGDDSWQSGLFNLILGLNPNTGQSQAYIDENALAYMAYLLKTQDIFIPPTITGTTKEDLSSDYKVSFLNYPFSFGSFSSGTWINNGYTAIKSYAVVSSSATVYSLWVLQTSNNYLYIYCASEQPFQVETYGNATRRTLNGKTFYTTDFGDRTGYSKHNISYMYTTVTNGAGQSDSTVSKICYSMLFGSDYVSSALPGVSNQPNATMPDTSTWNDIPSTLSSLQSQYPDLWNNALIYDNYQPDGSNPQLVYVPITLPNTTNPTDTQPTTGNQTQSDTVVNPSISPETLVKLITNLATEPNPQTQPETQPSPDYPPQNPSQTGTGSTPVLPTTSGSASALWSVYHPTQAQLNSFGAWLWTDNIITQIQQVLQNPMDGIITLHKVFITPIDSGNSTIVVGRLDSEVPSATVNQQYVYTDCGTVNCYEEFGNVFDYDPYTKVSLYLPFIGIVPLNTSEVMRSQINIKYGVDVFTGACLAMVAIIRDGNTVNMYQYSGMASVEYPLTGAIHNGLINGILGVAGGIAGIAAASTGVGMVAGIGALAAGTSNISQSSNAHAGSFSGNSGAMGIKKPYIIIERPQTKVANDFILLDGYPTNYSVTLGNCTGHVVCSTVHVNGINATEFELNQIESILKDGIEL